MEAGRLDNDGRLQMLKVKGVDQAHLEASQAEGRPLPRRVGRHRRPGPDLPLHARGRPRPTTNDEALTYVGDQGRAQGAAGFSRLEGAIYDNGVVYFTSTQGGGAAMTGSEHRHGYGNGSGRSGATTPGPRRSSSSTSRRAARCSTSRTTSRRAAAARSSSARTTPTTTTCAASPAAGSSGTSPSTGSGAGAHQRRVRRLHVQPGRAHPVRQHPGEPRHDLRDLGPVGADRRLTRRPSRRGDASPTGAACSLLRAGVGCDRPRAQAARRPRHRVHEPRRPRRVDVGLGVGHGHPRHGVVVVVEHRDGHRAEPGR